MDKRNQHVADIDTAHPQAAYTYYVTSYLDKLKEIEILVHNVLNLALLIFHRNETSGYFVHNQNICSNKHF